jgi:hypothetical protein
VCLVMGFDISLFGYADIPIGVLFGYGIKAILIPIYVI